jgi:hypothetical protein
MRSINSKFRRQMALKPQLFQRKDDKKNKSQKEQQLKRKHHTSISRRRDSRKLKTIKSIFL